MQPHTTEVAVRWAGDLRGHGVTHLAGHPLPIAAPTAFGGSGEGANPEELFATTAASCLAVTLAARLARVEIVPRALSVATAATVVFEAGLRLRSLEHRIRVELGSTAAEIVERARATAATAHEACFVSRALAGNAEVRVAVEVVP